MTISAALHWDGASLSYIVGGKMLLSHVCIITLGLGTARASVIDGKKVEIWLFHVCTIRF